MYGLVLWTKDQEGCPSALRSKSLSLAAVILSAK